MWQSIAMHIPDGFLDVPVSLLTYVISAVILTLAVVKSRADLDDRTAPLAGLTAVFIFAAQMINFPVASGTSGHLLGGALAAVLVGPWVGMLVVTVVLVVQALLFADGGLTALGANLVRIGFTDVADLIGGHTAWCTTGLPVVRADHSHLDTPAFDEMSVKYER